jgi:hypothetical protein
MSEYKLYIANLPDLIFPGNSFHKASRYYRYPTLKLAVNVAPEVAQSRYLSCRSGVSISFIVEKSDYALSW